jgi:hypothetical protein
MFLFCQQNGRQTHNVQLGSRSCEDGENFKYLGTEPTTENCILKETMVMLNSAIAYCHSFQNIFPSLLLPEVLRIKI